MTSLRARLWAGFGALLLIVVAVSTLSVVVLTRYSHALERVFRENYNSAVYCDAMKDALDRLDLAAQRQAWGAPREPDSSPSPAILFGQNLNRQLNNCTLPGELELSRQLAAQWSEFQQACGRFDLAPQPSRADWYRRALLPQYQRLKQTAQRVADMNMGNMVSVDGKAKRALTGVRNAMLILVSTGTILAVVVVGAAGASVLRPLKVLTRCAREIGGGNLDLSVEVRSRDEIGQLAEAFNAMAGQLRQFRRLDREKLSRTRQATQLAIDSLADPVLLLGPAGSVEIANLAARDHFGIRPGTTLAHLQLDWLTRIYQEVSESRQAFDPEGYASAIQIFDCGRERFLLPRAVPVIDPDDSVIGVTVVLVDVTRLRHADELKSGLLSTVSHELRTPLTSVRMTMALLADEKLGPLNGPQRKLVGAAREDSDRLYRIIEDLLQFSRIEAGRARFQPQRMSASEVVTQVIDPLRQAFAEKGLAVTVDVADDLPHVWADPSAIGYALSNLLVNALKFTPRGGRVRIAAELGEQLVRFYVSDTGPGIPPEYAGRIFDKFFRLPREHGKAGAGLGLTIAKELVEAHRGSIAYRPNPMGGSEFSFTIPTAQVLEPVIA